jgi:hypothetical protein
MEEKRAKVTKRVAAKREPMELGLDGFSQINKGKSAP